MLQKHGIEFRHFQTLEQTGFDSALDKLQGSGDFDYAIDLGMAWKGEWYPYAFGPFLQNHGGDIIDVRRNSAEGSLNGNAGMNFGNWWKSLFDRKLTPGTSGMEQIVKPDSWMGLCHAMERELGRHRAFGEIWR